MALFDGPERAVYTRVGRRDGRIFLDGGGDDWAAIEIDRDGWRPSTTPPVRFIRPRGMRPLPVPARAEGALEMFGRSLRLLRRWRLQVAHRLAARRAAPNGSVSDTFISQRAWEWKDDGVERRARADRPQRRTPAKRAARRARCFPRGGALLGGSAFDNVSKISESFSDALCRLSTGGGYGTRELYTNDEEFLFGAQRPVIINGIDDSIHRSGSVGSHDPD